jgi:hypothetical protein
MRTGIKYVGKRGPLFQGNAQRQFDHILTMTAREARRDFEMYVSNWRTVVKFLLSGRNGRQIVTDNEVFGYVDAGTKAHTIRPRRAKTLAFKAVYRAKTKPGKLRSQHGGSSGPMVYSRLSKHPGTKARKIVKLVAEKYQKRLDERIKILMLTL